ncbi:hypothetical protein A6R71_15900 [Xanthomonas translucens pv. arrhenatheri]|uniref:Uncharacterized protein n=2 Tax=Xanthomonas translucens group TaxID=3390202 RepID=A0A514EB89_9XANT|nr:hypothetical protein [Xanthomonas translucens]OAX67210.1 hypothetical protein A6R71_15900 [Xanthomonas translucens pv. arrhenatheri]QDI03294.1 hypothetical protein E4A48_05920 [Xanthomonas translucens pv. cerealis]UKE45742.1 hypothetical protein KHA79_11130 [Xanthomonas translucens pv. cerealis]UKE71144.1 hypothetical protein K8O61_09130 [Xanthomonas translucens pv. pistacia]UKE75965.1 hypothetical protein KM317_10605 [Xanthomonas translucens pv. arrhenatheri]
MRRHGFVLSRRDTDQWCRELRIDLLSLAHAQRRRRRRRIASALFAMLSACAALLAIVYFFALPW